MGLREVSTEDLPYCASQRSCMGACRRAGWLVHTAGLVHGLKPGASGTNPVDPHACRAHSMGTGPGGACELITAPNWKLAVFLHVACLMLSCLDGY